MNRKSEGPPSMAITSGREALAGQDQAPAAAMTPQQQAGSGRDSCLITAGVLMPGQAGYSAPAPGRRRRPQRHCRTGDYSHSASQARFSGESGRTVYTIGRNTR